MCYKRSLKGWRVAAVWLAMFALLAAWLIGGLAHFEALTVKERVGMVCGKPAVVFDHQIVFMDAVTDKPVAEGDEVECYWAYRDVRHWGLFYEHANPVYTVLKYERKPDVSAGFVKDPAIEPRLMLGFARQDHVMVKDNIITGVK